jgi:hypothetical protein
MIKMTGCMTEQHLAKTGGKHWKNIETALGSPKAFHMDTTAYGVQQMKKPKTSEAPANRKQTVSWVYFPLVVVYQINPFMSTHAVRGKIAIMCPPGNAVRSHNVTVIIYAYS